MIGSVVVALNAGHRHLAGAPHFSGAVDVVVGAILSMGAVILALLGLWAGWRVLQWLIDGFVAAIDFMTRHE